MLAGRRIQSWEVLPTFLNVLWYPKPLERVTDTWKSLVTLVSAMRTAMGGTLITYTSAVDLYDEYIRQYEINCIDWMNVQLGSNKPLGNQVPSVGTSDQSDHTSTLDRP